MKHLSVISDLFRTSIFCVVVFLWIPEPVVAFVPFISERYVGDGTFEIQYSNFRDSRYKIEFADFDLKYATTSSFLIKKIPHTPFLFYIDLPEDQISKVSSDIGSAI